MADQCRKIRPRWFGWLGLAGIGFLAWFGLARYLGWNCLYLGTTCLLSWLGWHWLVSAVVFGLDLLVKLVGLE